MGIPNIGIKTLDSNTERAKMIKNAFPFASSGSRSNLLEDIIDVSNKDAESITDAEGDDGTLFPPGAHLKVKKKSSKSARRAGKNEKRDRAKKMKTRTPRMNFNIDYENMRTPLRN